MVGRIVLAMISPQTMTDRATGRHQLPHTRRPVVRRFVPDLVALLAGLGLGVVATLPFSQLSGLASLKAPGAWATLAGNVSALTGTYLLLWMVLLAARIPALERALGQDRLIAVHRRLAPAPIVLLAAHVYFTTLGYAEMAHIGLLAEAGSLVTTMAWIFAAVVSFAMFIVIAGLSVRAIRRRLSYETWWVIHLYSYLAIALSVPHQIFSGTNFVGHPLLQAGWLLFFLATAGTVVAFRVVLPVWRSLFHRLRVVDVRPEAPGVYSVVVKGRHIDRLAVAGGQFIAWRFLTRRLWWHAHPFSLSALPSGDYLRVTIKVSGDTTSELSRLEPGTFVAIEGPYGSFTAARRSRAKVALIGAGVGITPIRALLEDLPGHLDVVVAQRASSKEGLVHRDELRQLVAMREGRLHELVGPRALHRLDEPAELASLVPDLPERDLYVCGPEAFADGVVRAALALGVAPEAIHRESFAL